MQECEMFRLELAQMDLSPNQIIADTIRCTWEETSKDPVLTVLHKVVLSRWPSKRKEVPEEIRAYWIFRDKILLNDDVLYKSYLVIVPGSLRPATEVTQHIRAQIEVYNGHANQYIGM